MKTLVLLLICACGASQPTPVTIAGAECVSHRTALQLACVDLHSTREDIDKCRADVMAKIECVAIVDGGGQ